MQDVLDLLAISCPAVYHAPQDLKSNACVKQLHGSLEEEREAVLDFLYKVIDDVSTLLNCRASAHVLCPVLSGKLFASRAPA